MGTLEQSSVTWGIYATKAVALLAVGTALTGCSGTDSSPRPTETVTVYTTETVTAEPTEEVEQHDSDISVQLSAEEIKDANDRAKLEVLRAIDRVREIGKSEDVELQEWLSGVEDSNYADGWHILTQESIVVEDRSYKEEFRENSVSLQIQEAGTRLYVRDRTSVICGTVSTTVSGNEYEIARCENMATDDGYVYSFAIEDTLDLSNKDEIFKLLDKDSTVITGLESWHEETDTEGGKQKTHHRIKIENGRVSLLGNGRWYEDEFTSIIESKLGIK